MPRHPTPDDIMRDLLALSSPAEARQAPASPDTPPQTSEAPHKPARERRRYETPTRQVHREWGKREQQRAARARAEEWLQALREWHIRGRSEYISSRNLYSTRPPSENPTVGQYTSGGSQAALQYREISTPLGWVSEKRVAALCNADPLLERIRAGGGLGSLIDERGGWNRNGEQARAYAKALLGMAAELGDERAEKLLHQIP